MISLQQVYESIGADYKGVLERLPSEDFVRRFALKFLDDQSFAQLQQAMQARDAEAAFRAAHTLKGVCQNLGFDNLYRPASELTEALRPRVIDENAEKLLPAVEMEYQKTVEALKGFQREE